MSSRHRGNGGAVESVESQKQASPSSHEPLGNPAKDRRDSHIPPVPTAKAVGKVENQVQVSHFPTAPIPSFQSSNNNCGRGFAAPPRHTPAHKALHTTQRKETLRSNLPNSGSSPVGIDLPFQAHLALESIPDFRLISGLENATKRSSGSSGQELRMADD
jgi:hypothetical protein